MHREPMNLPAKSTTWLLSASLALGLGGGAAWLRANEPPAERLPAATSELLEPLPPTSADAPKIQVPEMGQTVPYEGDVQQIDLEAAWRLAGVQNPTINIARLAIAEAAAVQRKAALIWFPNLNAGAMSHNHVGALIASGGQIRQLTEQSLYVGGGARTLAAESNAIPAVQLIAPLADAIYEPLALRQETIGRRFDAQATGNDILLDTTDDYLELLEAEAQWQAYRRSVADAQMVVDVCVNYAKVGEGRMGDAHRAEAEGYLLLAEMQRAEERLAIASAALAHRLQLDPSIRLRPPSTGLQTIDLVDLNAPLENLLNVALQRRPEMGALSALVGEGNIRVRQESMRPLLPLIQLGYSAGGFGGTGNFIANPPFTAIYGRADFDAMAVWTLQNAGAGNVARIRGRRAELSESIYQRVRLQNSIRAEVTSAYSRAKSERRQVGVAIRRLNQSQEGFDEDYRRLRAAEALPIEVVNSVRRLVAARQSLIAEFLGDNRAQFALFVALGQPPFQAARGAEGLVHPAADKAP